VNEARDDSLFRCPECGWPIALEGDGGRRCPGCEREVGQVGNVLDLSPQPKSVAERSYYDDVYAGDEGVSLADAQRAWTSLYYPMNGAVLERVGDVRGKTVVLLGNGTSEKELLFLEQEPALLVFSDLSSTAVRSVRDRRFPDGKPNLVFAAMDAQALPLADASVDLLYGYAFVHHLPDVDAFLGEAARVLRPGGRGVFMDDAYSFLWQGAKRTVLRPLMRYFHRLQQPSPEDLRFTLAGGFRETCLARRIIELGCDPWFERSGFIHYLVTRASERLPPQRAWRALTRSDTVLQGLIRVDELLARAPGMYSNLIRLVWGFDKPRAPAPFD